METINVEIKLTNGDIHYVEYEEDKEKFLDLVRFGEGVFLKDKTENYFAVKSIISFKFRG